MKKPASVTTEPLPQPLLMERDIASGTMMNSTSVMGSQIHGAIPSRHRS